MHPCTCYSDLNRAAPAVGSLVPNSVDCAIHRMVGELLINEKTYNTGGGAAVTTNLFKVTGNVEIKGIWGIFTDVTNVAGLTAAFLELYDGTISPDLTLAAGTVLTGAALGSCVEKDAVATSAITFRNSSAVSFTEVAAAPRQLQSFMVTSKNGVNTYIRSSITEAAGTNCKIKWYIAWVCRSIGSTVVAV